MDGSPHHQAHNVDPKTLSRFIMEQTSTRGHTNQQAADADALRSDLAIIINGVAVASKVIANAVTVSGIQSLHSLHGKANTTGDDQKTLDILSNEVMVNILQRTCKVGVMVSEENPDVITCTPPASGATYAVVFDPLDGSSNIECSVSTGTIFGVYRCKDPSSPGIDDALQQGKNLVCAGYVLYSSSTVMVLSLGLDDGVRSFTLDPTFGEFVETASPVAIPAKPKRIISVNAGNSEIWNLPTSEFVRWTKRQKERYSLRYIGSMVADVHRTLLYGGIFMYPADFFNRSGKLRLLYECFPMAFLVEAAGGMASTGTNRILDLVPTDIHQRCPIFLGCKRDVTKVEEMFRTIPCLYSMHDAPQRTPQMHRLKRKPSLNMAGTIGMTTTPAATTTIGAVKTTASMRMSEVDTKAVQSSSLLSLFCVTKYVLTDSHAGSDRFELTGKQGSLYQDTVQMSDAKWTLATDYGSGKRGLLPTKLLAPVASPGAFFGINRVTATTNTSTATAQGAAGVLHPAKLPRIQAAEKTDARSTSSAASQGANGGAVVGGGIGGVGGGLLSSSTPELCTIELTKHVVDKDYAGEASMFELSVTKGTLVQDVVRMADSRFSMATDCTTGHRGLLPSHILSPTGDLVCHKIANAAFVADAEFEVDFEVGDAAVKVRVLSDNRWCHAENTRTRERGVCPSRIFASARNSTQ